jgi:hypothetical protein
MLGTGMIIVGLPLTFSWAGEARAAGRQPGFALAAYVLAILGLVACVAAILRPMFV